MKRNPIVWIKDAWHLARPYWKSNEKYKSMALISLVIIFNLLVVYMTVIFNKWSNSFYDAIQAYDKAGVFKLIYKFCWLAALYIAFQIVAYYFRKILEIRWRRWMTKYYLDNWFKAKAYYKTRFSTEECDNPDQRISADIDSFIALFMDLTLGLMNSTVSLFSFAFILWHISGAITFNAFGHHINIQGYMLYAAILYALLGTYLTFKVGRPLIKLSFQQQAYEADFRFGLMRIREHSENIALYNGEEQEKGNLLIRFNNVVNNFVSTIYRQMKIDILGVAYGQIAIIFPLLVASPRYFAKIIKLGDLMQISQAFGHVQGALSYFISSYTTLSGFRAIMDRLHGFELSINEADSFKELETKPLTNSSAYLTLENITLNLPDGKALTKNINFNLNSGDSILIKGKSGSGKTTLLRTIAGLWHYASGSIYQKPGLSTLFVGQKPYLPISNLNIAICYPKSPDPLDDELIKQLLIKCNLTHLISQLDIENDWGSLLSVGEQQRIIFCKILINKPDIIYLDEVTSALDEDTEAVMYELLKTSLPNSVIISVGHRSTIAKWHNHTLDFNQLSIA